EEEDELYRDVNINQGRGLQTTLEVEDSYVTLTPVNLNGQQKSSSVSSQFVTSMLNPTLDVSMESIFETTSQMDVSTPTSVAPLPMTAPTMTPSTIATITTTSQAPNIPTTVASTIIQNLPNFGSLFRFDDRPRKNDEFLKTVDENIQKIIKEQVKEQVKALVEAYESDKITLDTYRETVTLKRRRDNDADKDKEPSAGPERGSKRRREGKERESMSLCRPPVKWKSPHIQSLTQSGRLEYHLKEVFKATTYQLDWVIPEGQQYPHNLLKPLQLIPNNRGRRVIPFEHFINNDLEYLRRGASSCKYTTSITKTKAADYGHIKWIEDLVPRTMWIEEPICYDKHALWVVSHWGRKRWQFYGFAVNRDSAHDVYSKRRIIAVTELKIVETSNKKNRLMRIDELHKFSDGTLTDVRTALDDRLKGIQMQYLPQSI
nr:hypothetical protein [Tanacetum cinerariifolium]